MISAEHEFAGPCSWGQAFIYDLDSFQEHCAGSGFTRMISLLKFSPFNSRIGELEIFRKARRWDAKRERSAGSLRNTRSPCSLLNESDPLAEARRVNQPMNPAHIRYAPIADGAEPREVFQL
jgi:hypothetical protein